MHEQRAHAQRGFTLIELMVVVAIVALLSAFLLSLSGRTYGANAGTYSEQMVQTLSFARMRAVSTRRIHTVVIQPSQLLIYQADTTGFADDNDLTDDAFVERASVPSTLSIWNFSTTVYPSSGTTVTQNTGLSTTIKFKPDGSSTGGTFFLADNGPGRYRVIVYRATGSVYARQTW
jgi:prepilin-type N-terminal cleavage/methylation domain-containing protein